MKKNSLNRIYYLISLLLIISFACNLPTRSGIQTTVSPTRTSLIQPTVPPPSQEPPTGLPPTLIVPTPTPPPGVHGRPFAAYLEIVVNIPDKFQGGYSLPIDLNQVQGLNNVTLSSAQQTLLSQNGFVVAVPTPKKFREFYQLYEAQRYEVDQPIFVTTDAVFHVYHLVFDKMLRDLETESFLPFLQSLTHTLFITTQQQYKALKGTSLEDAARRNLAYICVADQLLKLEDQIPPSVSDLVTAEMNLIKAHNGFEISPIWDRPDLPDDQKLREDYSQYVPRGHYTRTAALKRYFLAMVWYGRMTFRLRDTQETQRALLITQAIRASTTPEGVPAAKLWENIYDPTAFIVGKSDDLSYHEYSVLSDLTFGIDADPNLFADPTLFDQFKQAATHLPAPEVNSMWVWIWEDKKEATQGYRFMGQRFTLDEYIFGQLIWRNVGTQGNERWLPKGLDFFAAMGSEEALIILNELGETGYANYNEQMRKVRSEVSGLEIDSWTQNLYWSWLFSFQPVIELKDSRFPPFMQTQAWTRKDLNTALGSWTELKHDTILYAKQVMAEMGGGGADNPPHGYVEPNPQVYARLLALTKMTNDGLSARGILSGHTSQNLEELINLLIFLKDTSERELAEKTLSNEDYWRIQRFGGELENLTIRSSDCEGENISSCRDLQDRRAALVADVATGDKVLEEAIGQPTEIYVVLPDQPWRIAVGAVFSYYEFKVDLNNRLNDEAWWDMVETGANPPSPDWTKLFMVP